MFLKDFLSTCMKYYILSTQTQICRINWEELRRMGLIDYLWTETQISHQNQQNQYRTIEEVNLYRDFPVQNFPCKRSSWLTEACSSSIETRTKQLWVDSIRNWFFYIGSEAAGIVIDRIIKFRFRRRNETILRRSSRWKGSVGSMTSGLTTLLLSTLTPGNSFFEGESGEDWY